jgi:hypothetical protein
MQPVFQLSVDLTTRTATFTSGLNDAAKAARGSFQDIKDSASDMSRGVSGSLTEARHGTMLLAEEFNAHLPRALTSFIASIGPVGEAMAAAFPFLAIIVGATLLMEHLAKLKEKGEELTRSQMNFGTTVANVLGGLNDKLLQAGIRTDELRGDHLAALNKQLELIDHQSMNELVRAFNEVAKAADGTFAQLKTSWYQFGAGSAGAKHALDDFKAQYESLIAHGDEGKASDLLAGTRKSAERVLDLQHQIQAALAEKGTEGDFGDLGKVQAAENELKKLGAGYDSKAIQSQEILVAGLQAQAEAQRSVNETKALDKNNATQTADDKTAGDADKVFRANAESQRKADEEAEKEREKAYRSAIEGLQENERQKIEATKEGSIARLAAIDAAIKEEESKGLQETGYYRSLCNSKIAETRKMNEEIDKLRAEAGKEAAEHQMRMGELQLAAQKNEDALYLSSLRGSINARVEMEKAGADEEFNVKKDAFDKEMQALDKSTAEYTNKLKALQDKEEELVKEHENRLAQIKEQAEEQSNAAILSAEQRRNDAIAKGLTDVTTRHERMSKMLISLGDQMAQGAIQNAIKMILADDMTKLHEAAAAARRAFLAGEQTLPGVAGVVLGGVLAAGAFATQMAFADGGIVPGVGRGDIVPAMLEPGEGVLSNKVMDSLKNAAQGGSSRGDIHMHNHFSPHVEALDADSMDRVLTKHHGVFMKHVFNTARKMNQ